jgi:hypothetical protein
LQASVEERTARPPYCWSCCSEASFGNPVDIDLSVMENA